ncbi:MAG: hypothetical protein ICV69_08645 [Thermoleophilaceae bacterium]|nr:hypothetical protein [Thermoleophilaceae bacterium]
MRWPTEQHPDVLLQEDNALRRLLPPRNRWPELARFDERAPRVRRAGRAARRGELRKLDEELHLAETRDAEAHAQWLLEQRGEKPEPRKPKLQEEGERLLREIAAVHAATAKVLRDKESFVQVHRDRLVRDVDKAAADAKERCERAIAEAEQARQAVVELRSTSICAQLFPEARESDLVLRDSIAGGERKWLAPLGVTQEVKPANTFNLLREDAAWLVEAIPDSQTARDKLLGPKEAKAVWEQTEEGQAWKQEQARQKRERIARVSRWGTRWGD